MGSHQQLLITENAYIQPLKEVLQSVNPSPTETPKSPLVNYPSFRESLDTLFPEQQRDEKNIKRAKEVLGTLIDEITSEELKDIVAEVQYLTGTWLDDFERKIFKGVTLQVLLHDKGGHT